MKDLTNQEYRKLAQEALDDFKSNEGKDPASLICEIDPNIMDVKKDFLVGKTLSAKKLTKAIQQELTNIIYSKIFTSRLESTCKEEIRYLKCTKKSG